MNSDLFNAARNAHQNGQKSEAIQLYKRALMENPQNAQAWYGLSQLIDSPARKRECLERVLRLEPNHAGALRKMELLNLPEDQPIAQEFYYPASPQPAPVSPPSQASQQVQFQTANPMAPGNATSVNWERYPLQNSLPVQQYSTPPVVPPQPQSMPGAARFCTTCGATLIPGQRFCSGCGAPTAPAPVPVPPPALVATRTLTQQPPLAKSTSVMDSFKDLPGLVQVLLAFTVICFGRIVLYSILGIGMRAGIIPTFTQTGFFISGIVISLFLLIPFNYLRIKYSWFVIGAIPAILIEYVLSSILYVLIINLVSIEGISSYLQMLLSNLTGDALLYNLLSIAITLAGAAILFSGQKKTTPPQPGAHPSQVAIQSQVPGQKPIGAFKAFWILFGIINFLSTILSLIFIMVLLSGNMDDSIGFMLIGNAAIIFLSPVFLRKTPITRSNAIGGMVWTILVSVIGGKILGFGGGSSQAYLGPYLLYIAGWDQFLILLVVGLIAGILGVLAFVKPHPENPSIPSSPYNLS